MPPNLREPPARAASLLSLFTQSFPFWASWGPTPSVDVNTYCAPSAMQKQEPSMKPGVCIFNRFPRYFDRRVGLGVASRSLVHRAISVLHGHPPWHSVALLKASTRAGQLSQGSFQLRLHPYLLHQCAKSYTWGDGQGDCQPFPSFSQQGRGTLLSREFLRTCE